MDRYLVYVELGEGGLCMAHVPALPGCFVCAPSRAEAVSRLPEAIRDYLAWLRRHGEPAPPAGGDVEIEVVGESAGVGPFDPGDMAALLPPDRQPLTPEEVEEHFRLLAHSRAELLALVRDLPDDVLDWQPHPDWFTIRRTLRHVGNAEEWYVSRIVSPYTLPPEWEDDEGLPIPEFLEMERQTAIARLRQLTDEERAGIFYPSQWTRHPEEAWTARKALRRFLEHEREHTAQIRDILSAHRCHLLARLAAERAGLLEQLLGLDEQALVEKPVLGNWSIKDVLAHIVAWDRWEDPTMRSMVAGEEPDFTALQDFDASNATFVAERQDRSLEEVLDELQAARGEWVSWLERLPVEEFYRRRSYGGYDWSFYADPVQVQWQHDAEHAGQIAAWRKTGGLGGSVGPKTVLLAALAAAREDLLAAARLVPSGVRASQPVCGDWTLKDLLGHIANWEWVGVEGLRDMAAGRAPQVEHIDDIEAWNRAHFLARCEHLWDTVWHDFHTTRQALLEILSGMDQAALEPSYPFPWGPQGTPYEWIAVFVRHDRDHGQDLRGQQPEA